MANIFTYKFEVDKNDKKGLVEYTPFIGFSTLENINEELDSGYFEFISQDKKPLNVGSYCKITITDSQDTLIHDFYVLRDNPQILNKENGTYLHRIELIETTKKLEKFDCPTLTFTASTDASVVNYYLDEAIERVLRCYKSFYDIKTKDDSALSNKDNSIAIVDFKIDESIRPILHKIECPELVIENRNLREAIDMILASADAICYVKDRYTISALFYNELKKKIIDFNKNKESEDFDVSFEDHATEMISYVNNLTDEGNQELVSVVYPSETSYAKVKTSEDNYSMNDSNFGILLEDKIYNIYSLEFPMIYYATLDIIDNQGNRTQLQTNYIDINININNRLVEEEVYLNLISKKTLFQESEKTSLDIFDFNFYKENTIPYNYNTNFINLSNKFKGFIFKHHTLPITIASEFVDMIKDKEISFLLNLEIKDKQGDIISKETLKQLLTLESWFTFYLKPKNEFFKQTIVAFIDREHKFSYLSFTHPSDLTIDVDHNKLTYRIKYQKLYDSKITISKDKLNESSKLSSNIINNQNAKIISLKQIGMNLKSNVNRIGNTTTSITKRHTSLKDLYHIGDYTEDGYILTNSEYIYYNDLIVGKYSFTNNYSRINEYIGLNSQIRQYEIPNNNSCYERMISRTNYCNISYYYTNQKVGDNTFIPNENFYYAFTRTFNNESGNSVNACVYHDENIESEFKKITNSEEYKHLLIESTSSGVDNSLIFNFGFNNNTNAGYYLQEDSTGLKTLMNKAPYTVNGFNYSCDVKLIDGQYNVNNEYLPIINFSDEDKEKHTLIDIKNIYVEKDPKEILKFTYQINFLNSSDKLILGSGFARYNGLVYDKKNITDKLHIYTSYSGEYKKTDLHKPIGVKGKEIESDDFIFTDLGNGVMKLDIKESLYRGEDGNSGICGNKWIAIGNDKTLIMAVRNDFGNQKESHFPIYFNFRDIRNDIINKY